jgi:NADH-quinone oxidoreductase subunit I
MIKKILNFFQTGLLKGFKVTITNFFKSKKTLKFPEVKTPVSSRFKGALALRKDENNEERCIACKLCEVACPAKAIEITSHMRNDGTRRTIDYNIDMFKCINCGMCEEACPVDAVVTIPLNHYHMEKRGQNILTKEKLLDLGELYEKEINERLKENAKYN